MSTWSGKSKGTTLGYSIFLWILKRGGLKPAYSLLHIVAWYYILFVPAARRPILYLYEKRLGYDRKSSHKLFRKNIFVFGQTLLDKFYTLSTQKNPFKVTRSGGHHLDEMVAAGQGGIIVSAHVGNYEMAGHLLERLHTIVNIVMYDGEDTQIKQYLEQATGPKSFNIIYLKEDMSHIYEMSAALRRNELICLSADRFTPGTRTIEHEFLGRQASFPFGPFALASKLRAPVSIVFALKTGAEKYHFTATPPQIFEGRGTEGAQKMLGAFVAELENKVKEHPEQWFNYYDFWDTQASAK
jgi:predicted LPLAT superfamily acyltransferase